MVKTQRSWRWGLVVACLLAFGWAGCGGEPADRPSDCTGDEFFNERTDRCRACPVYPEPSCKPGCGFEVVEDRNGCPRPVCASDCDVCGPGAFFSTEQSACQPCPGAPSCVQFDCEGELRVTRAFSTRCPPPEAYACGACTEPERGCTANEQNQCVDLDE